MRKDTNRHTFCPCKSQGSKASGGRRTCSAFNLVSGDLPRLKKKRCAETLTYKVVDSEGIHKEAHISRFNFSPKAPKAMYGRGEFEKCNDRKRGLHLVQHNRYKLGRRDKRGRQVKIM